jgi:hypothetical protein
LSDSSRPRSKYRYLLENIDVKRWFENLVRGSQGFGLIYREGINLISPCQSVFKQQKIRESLDETRRFLNSNSATDWTVGFYQYVNRLAHLYLLRQLNDKDAYLVFVHFLNDIEMFGPVTVVEWRAALDLRKTYLGLGKHNLQKYIVDIFIDVSQI